MQVHCKRCGETISYADAQFVKGVRKNDLGHYVCKDAKACQERAQARTKNVDQKRP